MWRRSTALLLLTMPSLLCLSTALPVVLTPEQIGLMTFPMWLRAGGMSFFSAGIYAGSLAALRATASDVKLNRAPVDYSFKTNLRHVKEGPLPEPTSSLFPIKSGSGLHSFPIATTFL